MNTKRIVMLATAGALALGLAVGGVSTAIASEMNTPASHSQITPSVPITPYTPITPSNGGGSHSGGGSITPSDTVLTPQDIWTAAQANFSGYYSNARFEPVPGTNAFALGQAGGQVEGFVNASGTTITLGVAKGDFATQQQKIAADSTLLPGYAKGVDVYQVHGSAGDYEIFAHGYWISMSSSQFTSANAAYQLIKPAIEAIPQG